ncbi:MAG: hypothetical protein WBA07_25640 [Rivularia sp. (in: cyanobacteria)]
MKSTRNPVYLNLLRMVQDIRLNINYDKICVNPKNKTNKSALWIKDDFLGVE